MAVRRMAFAGVTLAALLTLVGCSEGAASDNRNVAIVTPTANVNATVQAAVNATFTAVARKSPTQATPTQPPQTATSIPPTSNPLPPTATPAPTTPTALPPTPTPLTMAGAGQQVTRKFQLREGLAVFRMTHHGTSNFIVHLLSDDGATVDHLANVIGAFSGSKAIPIEQSGTYLANVDADGAWPLSVEQPEHPNGAALPVAFKGTSQSVTPFFRSKGGLATLRMTHVGRSNFIVHVLDADGQTVEYVTNVIGSFDGSKAVSLDEGVYLVQVEGEGAWSVSISQ